ncbi:ABC-F family ATP-binding cassette domain-containing protein [Varunaivibrio sulfuroxidans]|uniref:ABC-F family ATP-binding cassette domain-containing protein n=1 Tax=Varunaivibrio sulfuroxidans TaxID=1773489 RepID=UPI0010491437|nr:ABC-F family ATP-binding cassette domain-containing protein [Varunaivibrio sulfuroxidans]WES31020.1 ABC-F family ATP-binding cassette domain-containing protein [Varunaivibrio sulfuroxidans]
MAPPLLSLQDISLTFGGAPLFQGIALALSRGERTCLVGRNGSGKSTLLKIVAGLIEPDDGVRFMQPGVKIAYLPQEPDLSGYATVRDFVAATLPEEERGQTFRADALLGEVGLDPDADPSAFSGGEAKRAAIARVLVGEPDILLLDEPTNHLDLPAIEWLEKMLGKFRGGFVLISHDRVFLNRLTRSTLWLDRTVLRRHDKGFADFEAWSEDIMAREEVERAKLDKRIAEETRWSHQGITARRKRNQGRLRKLQEMRAVRARQVERTGSVALEADSGQASGRRVIEVENVSKAYGARVLIDGFSTRIVRGDRVGVIGANGVGKSTLLGLLTGRIAPDGGRVTLGANVTMEYLDQRRAELIDGRSVWDTLCDMGGDQVNVRGQPRHVVSYLRDFLFDENQARTPVGSLSGGERNRLLLAKSLARPANLLVLDEPTNDLDMDTLDLLVDVLADYDGTLIVVSHDRDFLDRVVTTTILMDEKTGVHEYVGGYSDAMAAIARASGRGDATVQARKRAPERPGPQKQAQKLSYNQQRRLQQLPAEMDRLHGEIAAAEAVLHAPDLYARDPRGFSRTAELIDAKKTLLEACEEEWLELEDLRETIEAAKKAGEAAKKAGEAAKKAGSPS